MFGFDPVLLVLVIGFAIIGFAVSRKLKSVFAKYEKMPLSSGLTGAQVAQKMLNDSNIYDVASNYRL